MNKSSENIYTLLNNPFIRTEIVVEFYKNISLKKNNFLLAYLILPIILNSKCLSFLLRAKSTSSIYTFARNREFLFGFQDRIYEYKELTNLCIANALSSKTLYINEDLSTLYIGNNLQSAQSSNDLLRSANKLAVLLNDHDITTIYRLFGIKSL